MILNICDVPDILKVFKIIKLVINIIRIAVPIILIVSLMIDLLKRVTTAEDFSKYGKLITNKIIAAVVVFLVPSFIAIIISLYGTNIGYDDCLDAATTNNINDLYEKHMNILMQDVRENPNLQTHGEAISYLRNIEDEDLRREYSEELATIKKELDDRSRISSSDFLETARSVWKKVVLGDTHFTYGNDNYVPPTGEYIDCSTYVDWVLLEYGYSDFGGTQKKTYYFMDTNLNEKYGWEEVPIPHGSNSSNLVRPGDIVVRRESYGDHGHMDIIESVEGGSVYGFDAGSSWNIAHGQNPDRVNVDWFMQWNDKGKIIRVTPAG